MLMVAILQADLMFLVLPWRSLLDTTGCIAVGKVKGSLLALHALTRAVLRLHANKADDVYQRKY